MNSIVVDIADMAVTTSTDDVLITYSLGSCIGVSVYDPVAKVGGLMHCMLPQSKIDRDKAQTRPYMFVDTGMMLFLTKLFDLGATKANAVVKVAGGSRVLDKNGLFRIGERNYTIFRKILWKNGMIITAENVGGDITRTVRLDMSTGVFTMKSGGVVTEL